MAHWAELDDNNTVLRVLVGDNNDTDEGLAWLNENLGGRWVKTSYNATIRGRFAGIGYTYDEARNAFIAPQPFPSWVLNDVTTEWEAPTPMPNDGKPHIWDEDSQQWQEMVTE